MAAALPVYGKQYIRFAESARVPDNLTVEAFTLVTINAGAPTEPPTIAIMAAAG